MSQTVFKYPIKPPVSGSYPNSADAPTGRIDYLKIQRFRIDYTKTNSGYGGLNLPNNTLSTNLHEAKIYIAMPPSLSTAYSASYDQVDMGAAGVFGAQVVGQLGRAANNGGAGINADQIIQQLKAGAAAAMPEFAYSKGASLISNLASTAGLSTGITAGALQATTAGRIMNPFTEQVFNGVTFRNHTFNFKMFARNKKEAKEILGIIRYLKVGVLPKYGTADMAALEAIVNATSSAAGSAAASATGSTSSSPTVDFSSANAPGAFLEVPDRFLLEFVRLDPATDTIDRIPHYKFQPCVCTNLSVNYTPDGQYVSFKDAIVTLGDNPDQIFVPAVEISLEFAETRILTQQDGVSGY